MQSWYAAMWVMGVQVSVAWTREGALEGGEDAWAVVIDVLRATSSIGTALAVGARAVRPVDDIQTAFDWKTRDTDCLLAGERSCRPIPGFDFGNSPSAFLTPQVRGRQVVLATTNGSRALASAASAGFAEVLAVSLLNLGAVAKHIGRMHPQRLHIVCAGTNGAFSIDDAYVAGALIDRLSDATHLECDDAALAACLVHRGSAYDVPALFLQSRAGRNLLEAGLRDDVLFCARVDTLDVVPRMIDGVLVIRS